MDYNLLSLEKLNFASFQNGGFAQNQSQLTFVLSTRKFHGRKVFEKIKVSCWNKKIKNPPTRIFSKTFLPWNLRVDNTKLMQKIDWKKVGYFRSYGRKTIFDQPLGQVAPSWAKMKKLLPQFLSIFNTSKMQKKFWEKIH
jgi:hypothetical protein